MVTIICNITQNKEYGKLKQKILVDTIEDKEVYNSLRDILDIVEGQGLLDKIEREKVYKRLKTQIKTDNYVLASDSRSKEYTIEGENEEGTKIRLELKNYIVEREETNGNSKDKM